MLYRANSAEGACLFERPHHRDVALVLQSLDAPALSQRHCYFGGGTAMALRYGEYRESVDIDFVISDLAGYRDLRQMLGNVRDFLPIAREGIEVKLAREVRADQYGIRTQVRSGESSIKFEIVLELDRRFAGANLCADTVLVRANLPCKFDFDALARDRQEVAHVPEHLAQVAITRQVGNHEIDVHGLAIFAITQRHGRTAAEVAVALGQGRRIE